MTYDHGWLTPFQDKEKTIVTLMSQSAKAIEAVTKEMKQTRTCIQAGGNVGVYAWRLSQIFKEVLSFEPHQGNFECLQHNLQRKGVQNVRTIPAGLGERLGEMGMREDSLNIGKHRGYLHGRGTSLTTIDMWAPEDIDLIWLDIEGMEVLALKGGEEAISQYRPWIVIEENRKVDIWEEYSDFPASEFLEGLGYVEKAQFGHDFLFVPGA